MLPLFLILAAVVVWAEYGLAQSLGLSSLIGGSSVNSSTLQRIAQAVTNEEGQPGDRNYRNNNPGNLKPPDGSGSYWPGQIGVDSDGFAIFDSWSSGWQALLTNLSVHIANNPNQTITQYFAAYSPDSTGLSGEYGAAIAAALGVQPDTPLGNL